MGDEKSAARRRSLRAERSLEHRRVRARGCVDDAVSRLATHQRRASIEFASIGARKGRQNGARRGPLRRRSILPGHDRPVRRRRETAGRGGRGPEETRSIRREIARVAQIRRARRPIVRPSGNGETGEPRFLGGNFSWQRADERPTWLPRATSAVFCYCRATPTPANTKHGPLAERTSRADPLRRQRRRADSAPGGVSFGSDPSSVPSPAPIDPGRRPFHSDCATRETWPPPTRYLARSTTMPSRE